MNGSCFGLEPGAVCFPCMAALPVDGTTGFTDSWAQVIRLLVGPTCQRNRLTGHSAPPGEPPPPGRLNMEGKESIGLSTAARRAGSSAAGETLQPEIPFSHSDIRKKEKTLQPSVHGSLKNRG
jgi:hypothetical protein